MADYGSTHQRERARWQARLDAGEALVCADPRCKRPQERIVAGSVWDLGHAPDGGYWGPCHADCNRADGGRRARMVPQQGWTW